LQAFHDGRVYGWGSGVFRRCDKAAKQQSSKWSNKKAEGEFAGGPGCRYLLLW
jgi:hypothetical protein